MKDGFEVEPESIRTHADAIREVQSLVRLVVDAGAEVTPGGWANAYGLACQAFPLTTRPYAEKQIQAVDDIGKVIEETIQQLKQTADTYDERERENQRRLRQLHERELSRDMGEQLRVPPGELSGS